ncbi:two-partner secretion domain-containing protein [Calothrix sp. 336/3]|uniref:two-partner secretion domain-containing protein n=1 Tax=Calothrix sp. 336/3 TaxID=1337936 RepID=UPI0005574FC6|nr:filamentous hemagglutinin N-terminal domain-containing protein [Calothrix sp. 336/3]
MKIVSSFLFQSLSLAALSFLAFCNSAQAQITSDNSTSTQVTNPANNQFDINGGKVVGKNLFHSFKEFSVPNLGLADFKNATDIQNIFSRVTGGNISNILGTIKAAGSANLYLINPTGIIFGQNARLEVGGSFFASTADSLVFGNEFEFSAKNTQAPPDLLKINIPTGLRFRDNPGNITNFSRANNGNGLTVPQGKTLALIGGDVKLDGGRLFAPGGRIELGGLKQAGVVGINNNTLQFSQGVGRADVLFTNDAFVDVSPLGVPGGNIFINARNFEMNKGSNIYAGIFGQTTPKSKAGDIVINATDTVRIDNSFIRNNIYTINSLGNAGDIFITAKDLFVTNGAQIAAGNRGGRGNTGNIKVVVANSAKLDGKNSGIFANILGGGIGNGGVIDIQSGSLDITNGALIEAAIDNNGEGKAGTIKINVNETFTLSGLSEISTELDTGAKGRGGNVFITAKDLFIIDGARIGANTFGNGDAGNITIRANNNFVLDGVNKNGRASGIFSNVRLGGIGNGGIIDIKARNFSMLNGAIIQAIIGTNSQGKGGTIKINVDETFQMSNLSGIDTFINNGAKGTGGDIFITTKDLFITDGAQISANTFGNGDAGNITIKANNNFVLDGVNKDGTESGIFSNVRLGAIGNGGIIDIKARNFSMLNGALIQATSRASKNRPDDDKGKAGTIKINVDETFNISGLSSIDTFLSRNAKGRGGDIFITTKNLIVTDGGQIFTSTSGKGNAGNVNIRVFEKAIFNDTSLNQPSGVFSNVSSGGDGDGGVITIKAGSLDVTNGAQILAVVRSDSLGNGGDINITVDDTLKVGGVNFYTINGKKNSTVSAISASLRENSIGRGGKIKVSAKSLLLTDGGQIRTNSYGFGNAGNIDILVSDKITLSGSNIELDDNIPNVVESGIFSKVFPDAIGNGGNIFIDPRRILIKDGAGISTENNGIGKGGDIEIIGGGLTLDTKSFIFATSLNGTGGNISFNLSDFLLLRRGSVIKTDAKFDGGNITINTPFIVAFPKENSDITANAQKGRGGNIQINAQSIYGIQSRAGLTSESDITASSDTGISGVVTLNSTQIDAASGLVTLPETTNDASTQLAQSFCAKGKGSEFIIVGKGGLAENPTQTLTSDNVRVGLAETVANTTNADSNNTVSKKDVSSKDIVPARGWVMNEKGEVVLTAYDPTQSLPAREQKALAMCSPR